MKISGASEVGLEVVAVVVAYVVVVTVVAVVKVVEVADIIVVVFAFVGCLELNGHTLRFCLPLHLHKDFPHGDTKSELVLVLDVVIVGIVVADVLVVFV